MKYVYAIVSFIITFIVIFIIDYFFINKRKLNEIQDKKAKKKKSKKTIGELDYLVIKFKLDRKKVDINRAIIWISLINSFIISVVSAVIMLMPFKLMWLMLIAFALLFGLIYSLYEIYGRHLQKLEEKKNENK